MRSFEEDQALSINKCTTRRGNQEWYKAAARCEYLFVVVRAASFLNAQDDLGDIDNAWMSRLARRGTVLHKVGGGNEAFLVCGHTPCGVVALRLTMRAVDRLDGTRFKFPVLSLRQAETNLEHAKDFCRYVVVRDRAWVLGALSFIPTSHVNMSTFSAESQALL